MPARSPFTQEGLNAAFALIRNTVNPIEVREQLTYTNGDMKRRVQIDLGPDFLAATQQTRGHLRPPADNSGAASTTTHILSDRVPVLIATPRKGRLRSITDLVDAEGADVRLLSHEEHVWVAQSLLAGLLLEVMRPWVLSVAGARDVLIAHATRLADCVTESETVATALFDNVFDEHGNLRDVPPSQVDTRLLGDLRQTAHLLCSRYLVLADLTCQPDHVSRLTYSHLRSYDERRNHWRDKAKSYLGGRPSFVRVESNWARRTNSFHVTFEVPEGQYALKAYATTRPVEDLNSTARRKPTAGRRQISRLPEREAVSDTTKTTYAVSPSISTPHVLVANGARNLSPVDAVFLTQERPLGSAGTLLLTTALTATLATLLSLIGFNYSLANVTSPAILLALVAAIGTFAGTSVVHAPNNSSVMSKALGFNVVVLALTFSWVWSALQGQDRSTRPTPDISDTNGWLSIGLVVALWVVCVFAALRVRADINNFQETIRRGS